MSLVEFRVDRLDVQTVPKLVLFGGDEVATSDGDTTAIADEGETEDRSCPVSVRRILLVSIGATVLAVLAAKAAATVDSDLNLHC
jgi:hypothetical protein